ncbi:MAG: hypothetical protein V1778_03135 [bacterium]
MRAEMRITIKLDRQMQLWAIKINHVPSDTLLSAELQPVESAFPEIPPQLSLSPRGSISQLPPQRRIFGLIE